MDDWMYENAEMIGFAIAAIILWLVADRIRFIRRQLRKNERGRIINTLRGALMSKTDSDKMFMMRFEDAIENEIQEMRWEGRMNDTQEREYRAMFADFGLIGLYPMRDVKRGIQQRLKKLYGTRPLEFLKGGKPTNRKKAEPIKRTSKYAANDGG